MPTYRVYFLDGANRFMRVEHIDAPGDEEAVRRALLTLGDALKCEIWERDRLVQRIEQRSSEAGGMGARAVPP
jgi:hypothetical protein